MVNYTTMEIKNMNVRFSIYISAMIMWLVFFSGCSLSGNTVKNDSDIFSETSLPPVSEINNIPLKEPENKYTENDLVETYLNQNSYRDENGPDRDVNLERVEEAVNDPGDALINDTNLAEYDRAANEQSDDKPGRFSTRESAASDSKTDNNESTESSQYQLDSALEFYNSAQEYWSEGSFENALSALDQAYSLVLKVDTETNPELIQQKEDLRFMISKRILEIYASRYTAVNGNHNEIPLTMNEHVEREIKSFQGSERTFFINSYKRSGRYMDMIVKELEKAGLPRELAWLPLIESGFKVRALSRARALGLWQFIPSTGYKFGLKRDTWIDERLDPSKSTLAAIAYLKELHDIFGEWTTVLAGYNCGEGTVLKKIRNQKVNYLDNFWDLYEQLPRETARYVPRFLATLHILKDPEKYGFSLEEPDAQIQYETVAVDRQFYLKTIAENMDMKLEELANLNPELRYQITPVSSYKLKVPVGMSGTLLAKIDDIPVWSAPKNTYVYHSVKKGETLSVIALRYRTNVKSIVLANNISRKHFIRQGQKLKIPLRDGSRSIYASASESIEIPVDRKYRIKKGDSLWLIAKKFNTNTRTLERINNLKSTRLRVGQVLKIAEN